MKQMRELIYRHTVLVGLASLLLSHQEAFSQVVINSDADWPSAYGETHAVSQAFRSTTPDTLSISAAAPFFDDFSSAGQYPDTVRWFVPESATDVPDITYNASVNPPSRGTVHFDGNSTVGIPYNVGNLGAGVTDRLFSHYIDLDPYSPSSGIYLSFFLQPQGRGDRPEQTDSFFVYFRTPNPAPNEFEKVLAVGGTALRDFQQYVIPVTDPDYLHTGFQLLFQSTGSQNGTLDEWHLDYVFLAPNRSSSDTLYQDQALVGIVESPIAPYTALPLQYYQALSDPMTDPWISVSNLAGNSSSMTLTAEIDDPVGETVFVPPFAQQTTFSVSSQNRAETSLNAFASQPLSELSAIEMTVSLSSSYDDHEENNQLSALYPIDSVLAFDDGEVDAGFGLNQALGFGIQVTVPKEDSVSAAWISFQPTIQYNPINGTVDFLQDQSFRLVIWKSPHPDSILMVQSAGMKVDYGDRPNQFIRYAFNSPVPVPEIFWIGVQQVDTKSLGVGYDRNNDNNSLTFYDSLGNWVNPNLNGTLMIRPEFVNTFDVPASQEELLVENVVQISPNPLSGNELLVEVGENRLGQIYQLQLRDMHGRLCWESEVDRIYTQHVSYRLPGHLSPGIYVIQHIFGQNRKELFTEKLIIRP